MNKRWVNRMTSPEATTINKVKTTPKEVEETKEDTKTAAEEAKEAT